MIYNAWLAFKYRPRLSVWGKIVVWWVVVSLPWALALAWYTATGHLDGRFRPIVTLSAVVSGSVRHHSSRFVRRLCGGVA